MSGGQELLGRGSTRAKALRPQWLEDREEARVAGAEQAAEGGQMGQDTQWGPCRPL